MQLILTIETCGNPDVGQTAPPAPGLIMPVADYADASAKLRAHLDRHGLGGGNLARAYITRDGTTVARVSFNGRVWPAVAWSPGLQPIWSPGD